MIELSSLSSDTNAAGTDKQQASSKRIRPAKLLLSLATFMVCLLIAEGALRVHERVKFFDRRTENKLVQDPVLGHRLPPYDIGHDAKGFRNDTAPQSVDIVAIGDSVTWGVNVDRENTWPQELSKISGSRVYNMALGGYGPVQYEALIPQALELSPRTIIIALYLGNDLYEAYKMAYQYEAHRRLRSSSAGMDLSIDTVGPRADFFWDQEKHFQQNYVGSSFSSWVLWLRRHLALGRAISRTGLWSESENPDYELDKRWARAYPDLGAVWEVPGQETVFSTAYRLTGLDIDEPRNAEGLRITKELLVKIQAELDAQQVKLMVLVLPTKEAVYASAYASAVQSGKISLNPGYQKLVQMEERIRSEIISTCQSKHIHCVDARPYLSRALDRGERVYPITAESHPNARGYSVIAAAVNENLGK